MSKPVKNLIQVFEHQRIKVGEVLGDINFSQKVFDALVLYYEKHEGTYYSLGHNSIRFTEYVGVIQVGKLTIEVLPKVDKNETNKESWHDVLLNMLKMCRLLLPMSHQHANLNLKSNSILELYFELFLAEMEYLLRSGLIKRYRKQEDNVNALKGALIFSKHIRDNIIHKERFFTRHAVYDPVHRIHQLLYECLNLIKGINKNTRLDDRIMRVCFDFPEMPRLKVAAKHFENLPQNRKTEKYDTALQIARLLLLRYQPNIRGGKEHVLALMFDMNQLWEEFIYQSLRKHATLNDVRVLQKKRHRYWFTEEGGKRLEPDILIHTESGNIILDTKWKNVESIRSIGDDDLRQLFAYNLYFDGTKAYLVYPGVSGQVLSIDGVYRRESYEGRELIIGERDLNGGILKVNVLNNRRKLDRTIGQEIISSII